MFAKDLTGCFSHCCVEGADHRKSMSVSSLFMMVRGANFPPIIARKVSNALGSCSFNHNRQSMYSLVILIDNRQNMHSYSDSDRQ